MEGAGVRIGHGSMEGAGVRIGHGSMEGAGVRIGHGCMEGAGVRIGHGSMEGAGVRIAPNEIRAAVYQLLKRKTKLNNNYYLICFFVLDDIPFDLQCLIIHLNVVNG